MIIKNILNRSYHYTMKNKIQYTFWELINECSIEIPTIQRDYTYGRESAKSICEKLIGSILNSLKKDNYPLHLDFVYGKKLGIENFNELERNKNSIDTLLVSLKNYAENLNIEIDFETNQKNSSVAEFVTFIPLDGQQRLTSLFLIHWYVANLLNKEDAKITLKRFKYATRSSSKEFLLFLVKNYFHTENKSELLSESIENHEDFFTKWKKDPTVLGMLIVLDMIHKQFIEKQLDDIRVWENLTSKDIVTFDFFDLDDFELTDELYLKMNARGKKLTHFENFKAWLNKNQSENIQIEDWKKKLDLDWNDLFWNEKAINESKIDTTYLQYFKNMFLGDYLLNENVSEKDENVDLLRLNSEFNPILLFENSEVFRVNINNYLILLECFSNFKVEVSLNPLYYDIKNLNDFFFNKNQGLTWWHTTLNFAISRYIIANKNDLKYLNQWVRVISNLIYNTPIESPKLFSEAANAITKLIDRFQDRNIYNVLKELNASEIDFFAEKQKEEEIVKARLIDDEPICDWENLFIKLEYHNYFYGQIGFIFKLDESIDFEVFKENSRKVSLMFSEDTMKDYNYILFRSLLTYGNCFFNGGNTFTYPTNVRGTLRNRNENWRRFFDNKLKYIKKLNDAISSSEINIVEKLNEIIKGHEDNSSYLGTLIKNSRLLKYPEKNHIRLYANGYYLLKTTRIFGYYTELYTYNWFIKNENNKDFEIAYRYGIGESNLKNTGIEVDKKYFIHFDKDSNNFKIDLFEDKTFENIDEIFIELKNN